MITIDGAQGGGQMLRTALSYSALSGRPVRVVNIRGARPKPGLQPQHLLAVTAMAELCGAQVSGASLGSRDVRFTPGPLSPPAQWRLDIGSAGSVMLILQTVLPCLVLARAPVELTLTGGTNNPWAPPFEHLKWALLPTLARMGVHAEADLVRRGFYPAGGGEVHVRTQPAGAIQAIAARERGGLSHIRGLAYSANLPEHIVERMAAACRERLTREGLPCERFAVDTATPAGGPGCGVIAVAEFEHSIMAGDALGERGKPAEKVGLEAAESLVRDLRTGAAVDAHLADQLVPWAAIAAGESAYVAPRRTAHLMSATAVAREVLNVDFDTTGEEPVKVSCRGVSIMLRGTG